ncbi:MAG TPA: hypothetical protein VNG04_08300 [Candidatus Acidoferrum sp.]|nr:hypothetical protein [Candidatus Acidoferrum sp.]
MKEKELMLVQLGQALDRVARPHRCDEALPVELQANLWRLGVPCEADTPRAELVSLLWARKRNLSVAFEPRWNGPGATPPNAA